MMKKIIIVVVVGLFGSMVHAQSDLILYNFNSVPQTLHTNPAYPQQNRLWIALPGISGVNFTYHNPSYTPGEIFEPGTDINENIGNVINDLDEKSFFSIREELDLMGVGFATEDGFWSFGVRQIFDQRMILPGDLMRVLWFGNAPEGNKNATLNSFKYELNNRLNTYFGWQGRFMEDKLSFGARANFIIGIQNVYTERTNASVQTLPNSHLQIQSDMLIRTSGIAAISDGGDFKASDILPGNIGFGIDLGGVYDFDEHWQFSASVLDLGFISWKANTRDYVSNEQFEYEGYDADLSQDNPIDDFESVLDSLQDLFNFQEIDGQSYTRALGPRIFLGANYHFTEKHAVGLLYQAKFWEGRMFHDISANYQGRISRPFQYTVTYSVINGTYNNIGAGFSANLGPVQLYMLSDNLLHTFFPAQLRSTSYRIGINLSFYDGERKPKKNKSKNTPGEEAPE